MIVGWNLDAIASLFYNSAFDILKWLSTTLMNDQEIDLRSKLRFIVNPLLLTIYSLHKTILYDFQSDDDFIIQIYSTLQGSMIISYEKFMFVSLEKSNESVYTFICY